MCWPSLRSTRSFRRLSGRLPSRARFQTLASRTRSTNCAPSKWCAGLRPSARSRSGPAAVQKTQQHGLQQRGRACGHPPASAAHQRRDRGIYVQSMSPYPHSRSVLRPSAAPSPKRWRSGPKGLPIRADVTCVHSPVAWRGMHGAKDMARQQIPIAQGHGSRAG
jgi:hypothetical protein